MAGTLEDRIRAGIEHNERGMFVRMSPQAVETTATGIETGLFRVSEQRTPGKATARGIR